MILIDSNYLIALMNDKDQYHERAVELSTYIMRYDKKVLPLLMLSEAITSINSRKKGKVTKQLYEIAKESFKIYMPNTLDIEKSMNYVLKYNGTLSLADSLAVHLMKKLDILEIVSFDSDFDKVDGIIRIY